MQIVSKEKCSNGDATSAVVSTAASSGHGLRRALRAIWLSALWGGFWGALLGVIFVGDEDLLYLTYTYALLASIASTAAFATGLAVMGASVDIYGNSPTDSAKAKPGKLGDGRRQQGAQGHPAATVNVVTRVDSGSVFNPGED